MRPALRGRQAAWLKQIEDVLHPGFLSNRDKFFKIKSQLFQYRFLKTVLPGAPVRPPEEEGEGKSKKRRSNIDDEEDSDQRRAAKHPKETVRTDSKEQKMDRFITRGAFGNDRPQVCHQHLLIVLSLSGPAERRSAPDGEEEEAEDASVAVPSSSKSTGKSPEPEKDKVGSVQSAEAAAGDDDNPPPEPEDGWREIRLTSVKALRKTVKDRCHPGKWRLFL